MEAIGRKTQPKLRMSVPPWNTNQGVNWNQPKHTDKGSLRDKTNKQPEK